MKTHVTYTYNGRDIQAKGKTIETNSVTKLIDTAIEHVDTILSNVTCVKQEEYFHRFSDNTTIRYYTYLVDNHGIIHSLSFTVTSSAATARKAMKHFITLGIIEEK